MGSSPIRDETCVSCIGRWALYQWAIRETLPFCFKIWLSPPPQITPHLLSTISVAKQTLFCTNVHSLCALGKQTLEWATRNDWSKPIKEALYYLPVFGLDKSCSIILAHGIQKDVCGGDSYDKTKQNIFFIFKNMVLKVVTFCCWHFHFCLWCLELWQPSCDKKGN